MGSPDFAVPALRTLHQAYPVAGTITQPDRQAGRGRTLTAPPVKLAAIELGIPVSQPERLRGEALEPLRAWAPDLIVVAAFGQILRAGVLDLPSYGCINIHASLLPRWRGAAPIHAAISHGDAETGITIMQMDTGIDTGAMLTQQRETIRSDDTTESLSARLAELGARLLVETLPAYLAGTLKPTPQPDAGATYAPMLKKSIGLLNPAQPAIILARQVRACIPWPVAYLDWQEQPLRVFSASPARGHATPGSRLIVEGLPAISTSDGLLLLHEVQPPGKRRMDGKTFLLGARDWTTA